MVNAPSRLYTRTPKPPALKLPGGFVYVCHSVGPATGQPLNPDGSLILSYEWTLEGKGAAVLPEPPPPAPVKAPVRRGVRAGIVQADLFG